MWATSDGPKIEDFGITEDDLADAPGLFVASHRMGLVVLAYLVTAITLFLLMLQLGSSFSAAMYFTVIALAAGSVILVPLVMVALCAGEQAEERWLCRRVPAMRACVAYRRALAEHGRRTRSAPILRPSTPEDWAALSLRTYVAEVHSILEQSVAAPVFRCEREATGFDFRIDRKDRSEIFRCEAGSQPVAAGVGRELTAALIESEAAAAVILSVPGADRGLARYIADRSITVVPPWEAATANAMADSAESG